MKKILFTSLLALACASGMNAKVVLPAYYTDNMVIQQQTEWTLRGRANPGKQVNVSVSWDNRNYTAQVDAEGHWTLTLSTPAAGGPYELTFADGDKPLRLKNVMVGEVWFCSGQSNMEMPLAGWGKVQNYEAEIAAAQYPSIRLFQVRKKTSITPLDDIESNNGGWQECAPATVPEFSSVAYFYARALWKELGVPVGVIDCTWGGTPAEAWTDYETLKQVAGFEREFALLEAAGFDPQRLEEAHKAEYADRYAALQRADKGMENGSPVWAAPTLDDAGWESMNLPAYIEDAGLPGFDGLVWMRREITIPKSWAGKPLTLHLGMIDDSDVTYFNGVQVAEGAGYNVSRKYTVPAELVKAGKAVITVRVHDTGGEGGIHGEANTLFVECGKKRIPLDGAWKYKVSVAQKELPALPASPLQNASYPTVLYNGMVNAWVGFPVQGVIWYQGEANVGRASQYSNLFPAMIAAWRKLWNRPDMPFYFVQLANYLERKEVQPDSGWAFLREAQTEALHLDHTGMAVAIDIGVANDIHPKNKQEVGRRLSLLALADVYGKEVSARAPEYDGFRINGSQVEIDFTDLGEGLQTDGSELKGFIVAGPDRRFYPATAVLKGNKVMVSSPEVEMPQAVRYGWADNPECNLYGRNGLPVSPFRTDRW